ncbi:hypothetical protein MLD38_032154 [Melastoma candidum]|uniref:Uncharacterized protein n=1 Tax=Melastoma candidum TaxID=119954 RepID=A0ACB9M3E7_9MYRT|nr:hypothetical protein MLD38_032154 [Melastoma candidum]
MRNCAVLAFPFAGHARPLLGLVCRLAGEEMLSDVTFSFFSTAECNSTMFYGTECGLLPPNIVPYDIPDGTLLDHEFSGNPHEPADLFLRSARERFVEGMELAEAETGVPISSVIADAFLTFVGGFAEGLGIPWVLVWVSMPFGLYVYYEIDLIRRMAREGNVGAGIIPGVPEMVVEDLPEGILFAGEFDESSTLIETLNNMGKEMTRATAIVVNFCPELDPTTFSSDLGRKLTNLLHVGFLTMSLPKPMLPATNTDIRTDVITWLGSLKPGSVAYICFGTIARLPLNELCPLAEALETSGIPYIWSLPRDHVNRLPDGFQDRTRTQGRILSWAPQTEILADPATGVFVTHCGSNSVFESVANGVPMICRPFFGDHRMNGRMVDEVWKIGITLHGGKITKQNMVESLRVVFSDKNGEQMKRNARDLQELAKEAAVPDGKATGDLKKLTKIITRGQ